MLLYAAIVGSFIAVALLALSPSWGILAVFVAKPIVDTTWDQQVVLGLKLTEIVSGLVPLMILCRALLSSDEERSLARMPLRTIWLVWTAYVAIFSATIMYAEGMLEGVNVFFRHLNGLAGFYMVQAYFAKDDRLTRRFVWCLIIAALFPVGTGAYEALTGHHWRITVGEADVIRGVGFYHDAITIRYYSLQAIMGLLLLSALYLQRKTIVDSLVKGLALGYGLAAALVIQRAYSKSGLLTLGSWSFLWPLLLRKYRSLVVVGLVALIAVGWYGAELMEAGGFIFHKEIAVLQGTGGVERTFAGRWYTWQHMMDEWRGFGAMAQLFGSGHVATGAHNDYIQILFHGGMVGLTIYICLLLLIFTRIVSNLLQRVDALSVAPLLAFIMWMVDTIGLVPSAYSGYQWFVWGVIGLCFRKRENESRVADTESVEAATPMIDALIPAEAAVMNAGVTLPRKLPPALLNLPAAKRV